MFLLYRRRALCFGKVKKQKMTDNNLHVELRDVEHAHETTYDKIDDNVGNPLYACVGEEDDKQPMLSPVKKKSDKDIPQTGKNIHFLPVVTLDQ